MSSLRASSINGSLWALASKFGKSICQVLVIIILARLLSPSDFGTIATALIFVTILQTFLINGFSPVLLTREDIDSSFIKTSQTVVIIMSAFLSVLLLLSSESIGNWFNDPNLHKIIKILSVSLPLISITIVNRSLIQRDRKFKIVAKVEVASFVFGYALFGVISAYIGFGVYSLAIAHISQMLIEAIIYTRIGKEKILSFYINKHHLKYIFRHGSSFIIAQLGHRLVQQSDQFILSKLGTMELVGLYGRGKQLLMFPINIFGGIIDKVMFPVLAQAFKISKKEFKLLFSMYIAMFLKISFILSVYLYANASVIIDITLGSGWKQVIEVF